jgi:hypothetical protein
MSIKSKVDGIVSQLKELGICADEAAALKQAARDYDQAERMIDSGWKNVGAGGASMGVAAAGTVGCTFATPAVPIAVACWIGVGFAAISGVLWTDSGIDALKVAFEELEDQESNLDNALDKVCACIHKHFPSG